MLGEVHSYIFSPPHQELGFRMRYGKTCRYPTDAKEVCGNTWNEWIGFLRLPPDLAELGFWSRGQHCLWALPAAFRSGRMEAACWTPLGPLEPFWKRQTEQTTTLAPGRGRRQL